MELPTSDRPVSVIEGDCLDYLPFLRSVGVDAVISDPPYGMDWDTDCSRFCGGSPESVKKRGNGGRVSPRVFGDNEPFDPSPWLDFPRVVLFGSNHFAARLPVGTTLVWVKRNDAAYGSFLSDAEIAWMKGGHGVYLHRDLSMDAETGRRAHPTQKPIGLMKWVMERAKVPADGLVLDPYGGSGTTAVACVLTGRRCIVVERDPQYIPTIRRRVGDAMGSGLLAMIP